MTFTQFLQAYLGKRSLNAFIMLTKLTELSATLTNTIKDSTVNIIFYIGFTITTGTLLHSFQSDPLKKKKKDECIKYASLPITIEQRPIVRINISA